MRPILHLAKVGLGKIWRGKFLGWLAVSYRGLNATNNPQPLQGFNDADFATNLVARKSTTWVLFLLCGGPVSWGSRRQRATSLSTTDAKFFAASEGVREAIWLKALLSELDVDTGQVPLHYDSAISIIEDHENHQRVNHIGVKYFFVREQQQLGTIKMMSIPTDNQLADISQSL